MVTCACPHSPLWPQGGSISIYRGSFSQRSEVWRSIRGYRDGFVCFFPGDGGDRDGLKILTSSCLNSLWAYDSQQPEAATVNKGINQSWRCYLLRNEVGTYPLIASAGSIRARWTQKPPLGWTFPLTSILKCDRGHSQCTQGHSLVHNFPGF